MFNYSWFRKTALAEGVSFLLLLFVAMPLKYFAGIPLAVTVLGGIHGILFVAFAVLARDIQTRYQRNFRWLVQAGLASLLPFGTFYMDKQWKREEALLGD